MNNSIDTTKICKHIEDMIINKKYEIDNLLNLIILLSDAKLNENEAYELYCEILISRDDIDISIKLLFFKWFRDKLEPNQSKDLFFELLSMIKCEIYELEMPIETISLYKEYRNSKTPFDEKFNALLLLDDIKFHEVLCNKLCLRPNIYGESCKYLSLESISYDNNFESQLRERIGDISDEELHSDIIKLLKNAGRY